RDYQHKHHFRATAGGRGERARRHGKAGEDLFLDVPPGTAVFDDASGALLADLLARGQAAMVARGGRGGLGNTHFATATHQAPKHAQKVEPNLGVMELDDDDRRPTIADVPGLIERASIGAGLGHAFLRHVERTRVLVEVVDGSDRDPGWDYDVIREELRAHDPALLEKPLLVAFNKVDLPSAAEAWPAFQRARAREGIGAVAISAASGEGMSGFRAALAELLPPADELGLPPEPAGVVVHRIDAAPDRVFV